jgi:3-oxoacyl-[acyl-carrier protein] reductase
MSSSSEYEHSVNKRGCALVTGGTRGIGRATVELLAARGWSVAFTARSLGDEATELLEQIAAAGGTAEGFAVDAADRAATDALLADLKERHGGIGVFVASAGLEHVDLLGATADKDWDRVLEVDLTSVFRSVRQIGMGMARKRWGRIVLVSSAVTGVVPAGQGAYTSAKWGLEGLARTAAAEFARRGVTVNCVAPGIIDTAMLRRHEALFDEAAAIKKIPAARLGQPADVAAAIGYLVSDEAAYVTGTTLRVDGGLSAGSSAF